VGGEAGVLPVALLMRAVGATRGAQRDLAVLDLLRACLDDPDVIAALEACGVSTDAVRSALDREIDQGGTTENLSGRAAVLAAAERPHTMDAIDVVVADLFDPHAVMSRTVCLEMDLDRNALIARLSRETGRYGGITFPTSRVIEADADDAG
jgi:hypothetical protein